MANKYQDRPFFMTILHITYLAGLILGIGMSLLLAWKERPHSYVDTKESQIICDSGRVMPIDQMGKYTDRYITSLNGYINDDKARRICAYEYLGEVNIQKELPTPDYQNYRLQLVYIVQGSWQSTLLTAVGGIFVTVLVLTLLMQFLMMTLFKQRFSFRSMDRYFG